MSFWGNDDARAKELARRKEEDRLKAVRDAKIKAEKVAAARAAAKLRAKKQKELKTERDAEDKKLRDELVEKMLNGGNDKKSGSPTSFPTLNRGFGGDRAQPTNQQQCFKHMQNKPGQPKIGYSREDALEKDDKASSPKGGSGLPPLRRPF